jgi:lysozyme
MATNQVIDFIENRRDLSDDDKNVLTDTVSKYKDPLSLKLSHLGWDHIKNEEGLRLKVYKIGDGMVTVGYGHAEKIGESKLRVGQTITQEQAMQYLIKDVNVAAQGVKRMFKQWKEEGVDVKITQSQYDVLVSMAYNMGVSKLRRTEFVEHLKNKDFDKAAHRIKVTGVSNRFPGLAKRRLKEFHLFLN